MDGDAENALNTNVFHLNVCACEYVACLEIHSTQIRNPLMMHRKAGKKLRYSHSGPECVGVRCSPAASGQTQETVRAVDHKEMSAGQSELWPWPLSSGEKSQGERWM